MQNAAPRPTSSRPLSYLRIRETDDIVITVTLVKMGLNHATPNGVATVLQTCMLVSEAMVYLVALVTY